MKRSLLWILLAGSLVTGQDILILKSGEQHQGRLIEIRENGAFIEIKGEYTGAEVVVQKVPLMVINKIILEDGTVAWTAAASDSESEGRIAGQDSSQIMANIYISRSQERRTENVVKKRDYPWESTMGFGNEGFQPALSYRLMNVPDSGAFTLPLHLSIGFLQYLGYYYDPTYGTASEPHNETYQMPYALLEARPLLAQDWTSFVSLRALVGVGGGSYQIQRTHVEYYPDGRDENYVPITVVTSGGTHSGMGYILSTGLQLQVGRLEGEVRMNLRNGWDGPETFVRFHAGFRAKTPVGAAAAHLIWLVPMMVLAFILAGAPSGGIGGAWGL